MNERLNAIVGAKIAEFKKKMAEVRAIASKFASDDATKDINADISDFKRGLNEARAKIATFASTSADKPLNLDDSKFSRKLTAAQARAVMFANNGATKNINADTSDFNRGVTAAQARAKAFRPKSIWVNIKVRHKQFTKDMDRIADAFRDINIVGAEMGKGVLGIAIPALATLGAGAVAAVATAGVQVGVLAGGLMGLVSSFGVAAAGAVGLGAVMIPTIKRIKNANTAIKNGEAVLSDYSSPMQTALKGLYSLQKAYKAVNKAAEPYVLRASGTAMSVLGTLLTAVKPGIVGVAKAFEGLMTDLKNVFANAEDVKASISWFNKRAGAAVSNWAKIAGYAFRGFINLLRAFDPLAQTMEQGLLGMTKRFSEWAAGLSKSEKFKTFIEYVKTNGPKLLSSIGNIITGLVNIGVAFAPLAADMMTGFQKMTARFKEWSAALGENENFKAFVQYVRENGPQMRELIGNIVDVGIQLAAALGRVGEVMLPMINSFLSWTAGMLKAHPMIGNVLASTLSLMGAFKLIAPVIATFRAVFGGAIGFIWKAFAPFRQNMIIGLKLLGSNMTNLVKGAFTSFKTNLVTGLKMLGGKLKIFATAVLNASKKVIKQFATMMAKAATWAAKMVVQMAKVGAKYAWLGIKSLAHAAKVAASWVIAMGPVGWVIATVVALVALIIANWDKVSSWTKKAWSAVSNWVSEKWDAIWSKTKAIASNVANYVHEKFQQSKTAISNAMNSAWSFIKSIWNSIKSYITEKASAIWSAVKGKFQDIVSAIQEKMNAAWDKVKSIWGNIQSFFEGIDLFSIGADIISGLIRGIGSMAGSLWKKASSIADGITSRIKGALNINSPSRVMMQIGQWTGQGLYKGMDNTVKSIQRSAGAMAQAAIPNMSPVSPSLASFDTPSYSGGSMDGLMSGGTTNDNSSTQNVYNVSINANDLEEFNNVVDFFDKLPQVAKQR